VGTADRPSASTSRPLFGTDGVRGVANVDPVTAETTLRLGRALVQLCAARGAPRLQLLVGTDTRLSGDMLEAALTAGICSAGGDVLVAGTVPTPAVGFLTSSLQAAAGVVISASHNAFEDNGIKVFGPDGFKLPDTETHELERLIGEAEGEPSGPTGGEVGRVRLVPASAQRYVARLCRVLPRPRPFEGMKMVIDCAHGAAYRIGPELFTALGAQVVAIGVQPDGMNINRDSGAVHPQRLQERVVTERAHLGLALDGDADRAIFVDQLGELVDGDEVLAMIAAEMLARGTLRQATVVATVMSNLGLEVALRTRGARLLRTPVGDRFVVEEMRRHEYNLGGEQSGHLVFLDHSTTGDGLLAGLHVADLMVRQQQPLSELKRIMSKYPQVMRSIRVTTRQAIESVPAVQQTIASVQAALSDRGRVLVRYSGTEPLIRVMVEGEDGGRVTAYADEIAAVIAAQMGA